MYVVTLPFQPGQVVQISQETLDRRFDIVRVQIEPTFSEIFVKILIPV